jgi:hypothetical protein
MSAGPCDDDVDAGGSQRAKSVGEEAAGQMSSAR